MAGTLFPVVIHLWNSRQGKVLPVGSIAFLEKGSRRQARSRRLSEWWLLLLRCLLLLFVALLLSGPFWRRPSQGGKTKGWVLGVKEDIPVQAYKPLIDSLLKAGYEWHEWGAHLSYWDSFRMADRAAPAGIPFYIFTSGRRSGFAGKRPASGRVVHWVTYTPSADSASQWIEQAWLCSPDSIRVLTGSSRPTGNSYFPQLLPAKAGTMEQVAASGGHLDRRDSLVGQGVYHMGLTNGHLSVALDSQPPVIVDTAALLVWIYTDNKYNNDSRYLVAAFRALQQFTRRNIRVIVGGGIFSPEPHADWIFWLSSVSVPAGLPVSNIVCYEPGREIPVDTWMQGITGVTVSKRVEPDPANGREVHPVTALQFPAIWKDGFGRPILSLETSSGRRIFHFFSHFDPAWNGLVWSPRFPVLLQDLLATPASFASGRLTGFASSANGSPDRDRRVLDPEQILPQKILPSAAPVFTDMGGASPGSSVSSGSSIPPRPDLPADGRPSATIDLAPACWILILLLFLAERMLSLRSPKIKSYG
jgi:hypothetical protein